MLAVLDVFSWYLWLRSLQSKQSREVASILTNLYNNEGRPTIIQCDQCTEFQGRVSELYKQCGIHLIRSRPYHPESQEKVEASHRVWKRMIWYDVNQGKRNWVKRLGHYAMLYGSAVIMLGLSLFPVPAVESGWLQQLALQLTLALSKTGKNALAAWHVKLWSTGLRLVISL